MALAGLAPSFAPTPLHASARVGAALPLPHTPPRISQRMHACAQHAHAHAHGHGHEPVAAGRRCLVRRSHVRVVCLVPGGWVIVHSLSAYPVAIIAFGHSATGLEVVSRRACGTCRSIVVAGGFLCSAPVLVQCETVSTLPCFPVQGCLPPRRRSRALSVVVVFIAWVRPW